MKVKSESEVTQSCPTLRDPMDCSYQAPPSMGFSRQEYWSGVPLPFPDSNYSPSITSNLYFFALFTLLMSIFLLGSELHEAIQPSHPLSPLSPLSPPSPPAISLSSAMVYYQRRRWHPTPVLLPGKSHGWWSLVGCSRWGR